MAAVQLQQRRAALPDEDFADYSYGMQSSSEGTAQGQAPGSTGVSPVTNVESSQNVQSAPTTSRMSYADWFRTQTSPRQQNNPEYDAKKRRREAIVSAIGDGISSVANLLATSKGAPNAYNPKLSLSSQNYARWEKLRAQQQAADQNYYNSLYKWQQMDDAIRKRKETADATASWRQMQNDLAKERLQREKDNDRASQERNDRKDKAEAEKFEWQKQTKATESRQKDRALNIQQQRVNKVGTSSSRSGRSGEDKQAIYDEYEKLKKENPELAKKYEESIGVGQGGGRNWNNKGKGMTVDNARQGIAHIKKNRQTSSTSATQQRPAQKKKAPSALR